MRFKGFTVCFLAAGSSITFMADYIDGISFTQIAIAPILTVIDFTHYFSWHSSTPPYLGFNS
jgi:hypothetical protein